YAGDQSSCGHPRLAGAGTSGRVLRRRHRRRHAAHQRAGGVAMTLDELKRIDDAASSAKSLSEKLRNAAGLLAAIRNAEQQRSALEIVHELGRSYGYGSDDAKAALH